VTEAIDRALHDSARQFINDILRINAEHGMRSVEDEEVIEAAVAKVERWARALAALNAANPAK
jgi:hypothetical protein